MLQLEEVWPGMGMATKQRCCCCPRLLVEERGRIPIARSIPSVLAWEGGWEKPASLGKVPPWWLPRGGSGRLALGRVLLGVPHHPGGMRVSSRIPGCRKAAGGGLAAPNVGKG